MMTNTRTTRENLQTAIEMELVAAHQYQLHAHVLEDWGLTGLSATMRGEVVEEVAHADRFIARLMFLGGEPVLTMKQELRPAKGLTPLFEADLADERHAIGFYTEAALQAAADGDIGTRKLFEDIVLDEEGHMAWLDLQLNLINRLGEAIYTAQHMGGPATA
jgi:bacterioferritin